MASNKLHIRGEHDCLDIPLQALTNNLVSIDELITTWKNPDRKSRDKDVKNFLAFNKVGFNFLHIDQIQYSDNLKNLIIKTGNTVGCIPLYSPVTGKPYANLFVNGRFGEDISELLPLLKGRLDIEFNDNLKLPHLSKVKPPIYFECAKFMEKYMEAYKLHWHKFKNEVKIQNQPSASTQWDKYATYSYDPKRALLFPNRINRLVTNHKEWNQINYVLTLCFNEFSAHSTPRRTKSLYSSKIQYLKGKVDYKSIEPTLKIQEHNSDPIVIKELKKIGNRILNSVMAEYRAWSLDFSKLYEMYVQYIISEVIKGKNEISINNATFGVSGQRASWSLAYLEPDIIIRKGTHQIIVDAKYKTHMLNSNSSNVNTLKDEFRSDLHQVLAYSSFSEERQKSAILIYPANHFIKKVQTIRNPYLNIINTVYLVGIPFGECKENKDGSEYILTQKQKIDQAVNGIREIINFIFEEGMI